MGKKYKKSISINDVFGYYANKDDDFEKEVSDDLENMDVETDNVGETSEIQHEDLGKLEEGRDILLKEITTLANGEERTRAIGDLKEIEAMMFARRRYERKKEKMGEELKLKQQELDNDLELKREEMERDFEHKQKELEQEREKMEQELALKKEEMAQNREMHEEEIKVQKRGTLIGALVNIASTIFMMGAYNFLLDKQNRFESGENYSTSGSRGLTNNIASIPRSFGKR